MCPEAISVAGPATCGGACAGRWRLLRGRGAASDGGATTTGPPVARTGKEVLAATGLDGATTWGCAGNGKTRPVAPCSSACCVGATTWGAAARSEEHTSELQS